MSVQKWTLGGVTWDWNPSEDSDWATERIVADLQPIGSSQTILQTNGYKSAIRTATGTTTSQALMDSLDAMFKNGGTYTLTDHRNRSANVTILKFTHKMRKNAWAINSTYDYSIEFMQR